MTINRHFMFNNIFFRKSWRFLDDVKNVCRAGQAADGNMVRELCMLDT